MRTLGFALTGYFMFGLGYIGYMTFVIALLKEQGMSASMITLFYTLLGLAVMASSRLWAGMLDKFKGGESLAILNALLSVATLLPAVTAAPVAVFISGQLVARHQRLHDRVRGRPDRRPDRCRLDRRPQRRTATGSAVFGVVVADRRAAGMAPTTVASAEKLNTRSDRRCCKLQFAS